MLPTRGSSMQRKNKVSVWTYYTATKGLYLRGLASVKREQMDNKTLEIVKAGDQFSFKMSRQIAPWLLMLQ
jgi:hypothetical protein